jgi:hypothetical protein
MVTVTNTLSIHLKYVSFLDRNVFCRQLFPASVRACRVFPHQRSPASPPCPRASLRTLFCSARGLACTVPTPLSAAPQAAHAHSAASAASRQRPLTAMHAALLLPSRTLALRLLRPRRLRARRHQPRARPRARPPERAPTCHVHPARSAPGMRAASPSAAASRAPSSTRSSVPSAASFSSLKRRPPRHPQRPRPLSRPLGTTKPLYRFFLQSE